jgi:hypothetical protein
VAALESKRQCPMADPNGEALSRLARHPFFVPPEAFLRVIRGTSRAAQKAYRAKALRTKEVGYGCRS